MAAGDGDPFVGLCNRLSGLLDVAKSTVNSLFERLQGGFGVRTASNDADRLPAGSAELKNGRHGFSVRDLGAILHADIRLELAGKIGENRRRPRKPSRAPHAPGIDVVRSGRWRSSLRLGGGLRGFAAQACNDVV